ncbi:hypothetical protein DF156_12785 [Burkholderia ubonensis]|nr:hypothetical protein DF155_21850 [Burkholderia ubonensis]RQP38058.1 hypothetical protein DF154_17625 [Burkholderia ubonensis]RQP42124.1 hypothetical protein DF156_12785 [Burkholderia ubonensis]RQP56698.1 hypothetical protein DF144_10610 [Burkholderia ubonensis]RQP61448.1 hypothetical protein DF159_15215 [Burkholderia ubonensis]
MRRRPRARRRTRHSRADSRRSPPVLRPFPRDTVNSPLAWCAARTRLPSPAACLRARPRPLE